MTTERTESFLARWGETVKLLFGDGWERDVTAVVNRTLPASVPEMPGVLRPLAQVFLANDATDGLTGAELDTASLRFQFPGRIGGDTETFQVHQLIAQDAEMIALEVR